MFTRNRGAKVVHCYVYPQTRAAGAMFATPEDRLQQKLIALHIKEEMTRGHIDSYSQFLIERYVYNQDRNNNFPVQTIFRLLERHGFTVKRSSETPYDLTGIDYQALNSIIGKVNKRQRRFAAMHTLTYQRSTHWKQYRDAKDKLKSRETSKGSTRTLVEAWELRRTLDTCLGTVTTTFSDEDTLISDILDKDSLFNCEELFSDRNPDHILDDRVRTLQHFEKYRLRLEEVLAGPVEGAAFRVAGGRSPVPLIFQHNRFIRWAIWKKIRDSLKPDTVSLWIRMKKDLLAAAHEDGEHLYRSFMLPARDILIRTTGKRSNSKMTLAELALEVGMITGGTLRKLKDAVEPEKIAITALGEMFESIGANVIGKDGGLLGSANIIPLDPDEDDSDDEDRNKNWWKPPSISQLMIMYFLPMIPVFPRRDLIGLMSDKQLGENPPAEFPPELGVYTFSRGLEKHLLRRLPKDPYVSFKDSFSKVKKQKKINPHWQSFSKKIPAGSIGIECKEDSRRLIVDIESYLNDQETFEMVQNMLKDYEITDVYGYEDTVIRQLWRE